MKIYKYEIPLQETCQIEVPGKSKILDVQVQDGKIQAWVKIIDENCDTKIILKFYIVATGLEFNHSEDIQYCKTVQLDNFVWHIFVSWDYKKEPAQ